MTKLGYARVSIGDQNLDLQIDALTGAGVKERHIYQEKMSGTKSDRPQLEALLKAARDGDVIVVWRLDRLGRSMKHLVQIVDDLKSQGIGFVSIQDGIDTTTINGELIFGIFASLAQFEQNLISERTRAGLRAARARGRKGGRPKSLTAKQIKTAQKMYDKNDWTMAEIAETVGTTVPTLYRHIKVQPMKSD